MAAKGFIYGYNLSKSIDTVVKILLSEIPMMIRMVENKEFISNEGGALKHIDSFVIGKRTLEENIELFEELIKQLPVEWQGLVRQRCYTCKKLSKANFYRTYCLDENGEELEVEKYFKIIRWRYADSLGFPVCHDMKKSELNGWWG